MPLPPEQIEAEALKLPEQERARIAERLLASLGEPSEAEIDAVWIAEAERRHEELVSGKSAGVPVEEAFQRLASRRR